MEDKKFKITLINHSLSEPYVGEKFVTFRYLTKEKGTSVVFKVPKNGGKWLKENIRAFLEGKKEIYVRGHIKKISYPGRFDFLVLIKDIAKPEEATHQLLIGKHVEHSYDFLAQQTGMRVPEKDRATTIPEIIQENFYFDNGKIVVVFEKIKRR